MWVPLWSSMSLAWLRSSVSLPSFSDRAGAPTGFALAVEPVSRLRLVDCFAPRLSRLSWCSCGHLGGEPVSLWGSVECFAPELQRLSWCSYEGRPGGRACLPLASVECIVPELLRLSWCSRESRPVVVELVSRLCWSSVSLPSIGSRAGAPAEAALVVEPMLLQHFGRVYRSRASMVESTFPLWWPGLRPLGRSLSLTSAW